jgi:branched-chain amino acid aminotransferase
MSLTWWNGQVVQARAVRIAPDDAGFLHGDGLFETLRVEEGQPRHVGLHLDRLLASLPRVEIEIPEDRKALEDAVAAVAFAGPRPTARLRITVTRGAAGVPTRLVTAVPYDPPDASSYREGVAAVLVPDLRLDARGPLAGLKSLCWQTNRLALLRAGRAGAFEALLMNQQGRLVEGARSNLVVVLDDGIFTPPLEDGCLPGTIRRRLLEAGAIAERPLAPEDLERAREVLLTNSLVGVLPVGTLNERKIPVGEAARDLREAAERT